LSEDLPENDIAAEEIAPMEIHVPKPWHRLREFLKEYAIVVLGVLTALAGEQLVEWAHWRHEVGETEQALRQELSHDLAAMDYRLDQGACVDRRLDDLDRWRLKWIAGEKPSLTGPISAPVEYTLYTDAWEVAETGQVAAHIPLERRMQYAKMYAAIRALKAKNDQEAINWRNLQDFDQAPLLDAHDLMRLRGLINYLQYYQVSVSTANAPLIRKRAADLGVGHQRLEGTSPDLDAGRAALCTSILPS
jgi:hypothetical protein